MNELKKNSIVCHDVTKPFPLPDNCIDTVITSPPYWGLRDYGVGGQIGLEKHPSEYIDHLVRVAREIKRVLKKSGSFYLNLGDTYFGSGAGTQYNVDVNDGRKEVYALPYTAKKSQQRTKKSNWLQPLNFDTWWAWLAGVIDSDGCIGIRPSTNCGRKYYYPYMIVAMGDKEALEKCKEITGVGCILKHGRGKTEFKENREMYSWSVSQRACANIIKKIYPYLVVKKKQAEILWSVQQTISDSWKGQGDNKVPKSIMNKRIEAWKLCKRLNQREEDVELPNWIKPPTYDSFLKPKQLLGIPWRVAIALQDDGWILRNDIIWHKPNPMPSSVKDRLNCTFEHVFHFVKARKYYFDLDAIREPHSVESLKDLNRCKSMRFITDKNVKSASGKTNPCDKWDRKRDEYYHPNGKNPGDVIYGDDIGNRGRVRNHLDMQGEHHYNNSGKNPGDFWDICTQPFTSYSSELEHFAVFPEELIEKPLKSSCPTHICKKCGKPRIRLTKPIIEFDKDAETKSPYVEQNLNAGKLAKKRQAYRKLGYETNPGTHTIGWSDCGCNAGFKPGVVLDPFCGRGTVGKVAKQLGLNYILFDIKPEYVELARLYVAGQKHKLIKYQNKLDLEE